MFSYDKDIYTKTLVDFKEGIQYKSMQLETQPSNFIRSMKNLTSLSFSFIIIKPKITRGPIVHTSQRA